MNWENILKRRGKFTSNNLPMLKEMVNALLDDIPEGTEFYARDYVDEFFNYLPEGIAGATLGTFKNWASKPKSKEWFKKYITQYSQRIGKTVKIPSPLPGVTKLKKI